ncbi:MAG TPA: gluconate 2-dehydrogenase subunit 3 family protein [Bryobacteraceae bacterium]|nr:gluconate 2-dehydrogenase subunit 3 family protein [Bryobacteraceae bacterium]
MSKRYAGASRREMLRNIAMGVTLAGMPLEAAQHVHGVAADQKKKTAGVYKPKHFNTHEYGTVRRLAELIIPADDVSGSAIEAGAPEFIDLIAANNQDIGLRMTGGLAWLDRQMETAHGKSFVACNPAEQTGMLDRIANREKATPELGPGVEFFRWIRRLTADAFYTSPIGVKDVGYVGNKGMTTFQVPASALEYAAKRSGLT